MSHNSSRKRNRNKQHKKQHYSNKSHSNTNNSNTRKHNTTEDHNEQSNNISNEQNSDEEEHQIIETQSESLTFDTCDRCLFSSFGFALMVISILVTFFNEHDFILAQTDINSLTNNIQHISIDDNGNLQSDISPNILKHDLPIHLTSKLQTPTNNEWPMDEYTDITYDTIAMRIRLQMYQWKEEKGIRKQKTSTDGSSSSETITTYKYSKVWSNSFIDSSEFKYEDNYYNPQPSVSSLQSRIVWTDNILIGDMFYISKSLRYKLYETHAWHNITINITTDHLEGWEIRDGYLFRAYDIIQSYSEDEDEDEEDGDGDGDDGENDEDKGRLDIPRLVIGDIRLSVESMDPRGRDISFIGSLVEKSNKKGYNLAVWSSETEEEYVLLKYGRWDMDICLETFANHNIRKVWLSRILTLLMMVGGYALLPSVMNYTIVGFCKSKIQVLNHILHIFVGSIVFGFLQWMCIWFIAYFITKVEIAFIFITSIIIGIFVMYYLSGDVDTDDKHIKQI